MDAEAKSREGDRLRVCVRDFVQNNVALGDVVVEPSSGDIESVRDRDIEADC